MLDFFAICFILLCLSVKPVATAVNSSINSIMGNSAVLKVAITEANPIVLNDKRTWQKDGTELNGTKYSFSSDRLTLTINNVVASDVGNYIFTATNRAGSGTATIMVIVPGIVFHSVRCDFCNDSTLFSSCRTSSDHPKSNL